MGDAAVRCSVVAPVEQSHAEQDEPGGAVALSGVRLQELEYLFVGAARIPGEGVADLYEQVQVAEGERVGCAEGALQGFGGGPGAHTGYELAPVHRIRQGHDIDFFQARGIGAGAQDRGRIPSGAGPGGISPYRPTKHRQAKWSLPVVIRGTSALGTNDSITSPVRADRSPPCLRCAAPTTR